VIDMVFTKEQSDKLKFLIASIPEEVERIIQHHEDLQDITKEYLGESISKEVMKKIIKQEIEKDIYNKMVGVLFGK
tara:strand:- start:719 stop:946 length:228 start_codon:yes stop_codon:yes gene_type:complete